MRHKDWQTRFWRALESERTQRFVWGKRDCALFAASMADAISDGEYVRRAREVFTWSNEDEALALLSERSLTDLVESVLGPMQRWQRLGMGDMVIIRDDENIESLCIHDGVQLIGPKAIGYRAIPVRYALGGWRVE